MAGAHTRPCAPARAKPATEEDTVRSLVRTRNPFRSLFATTRREQYLERYVLREHAAGRSLAEILDDPYIQAWSTPEERARLLERPEVVAAVGENAVADLRSAVAAQGARV